MPSLIDPIFPIIRTINETRSKDDFDYEKKSKNEFQIVAEFFYSIDIRTSEAYSNKVINEEFIVYIKKNPKSINLEFYYLNGEFMCSKTYEMTEFGTDYDIPTVFDFKLSNNGRYLLIFKAYKQARHTKNNYWRKIEAEVNEIVLVCTEARKKFLKDRIMSKSKVKAKTISNLQKFIRKNVLPGVS